ncbi:hypothetical protein A9Q91_02520 [Candidatus Gracilibacteria bacterium 28_42_T64]|nr:hypothetical protein A9Q91_02520 [Candidatus Gracilibacteria bacterium 28_42_T64]
MKDINITCNSTLSCVMNKSSTVLLKYIIATYFGGENNDIIQIFQKIKNIAAISLQEKDLFLKFMETSEFKQAFIETKDEFIVCCEEKNEIISYSNLLTEVTQLAINCRCIEIMESGDGILDTGKEYYFDLRLENGKKKFYKEIAKFGEYQYVYDIRTMKFNIIKGNKVLLESNYELSVGKNIIGETCTSLDETYLFFGDSVIPFNRTSEIAESKYSFFIVDGYNARIIRIDKSEKQVGYIEFTGQELLRTIGNYVLIYDRGEMESNGDLYIYSLDKNQKILSGINFGDYIIEDGILVGSYLEGGSEIEFDFKTEKI